MDQSKKLPHSSLLRWLVGVEKKFLLSTTKGEWSVPLQLLFERASDGLTERLAITILPKKYCKIIHALSGAQNFGDFLLVLQTSLTQFFAIFDLKNVLILEPQNSTL